MQKPLLAEAPHGHALGEAGRFEPLPESRQPHEVRLGIRDLETVGGEGRLELLAFRDDDGAPRTDLGLRRQRGAGGGLCEGVDAEGRGDCPKPRGHCR